MIDSSDDTAEAEKEAKTAEAQPTKEYPVKGIPNLDFYRRTYARSCGENDDKAVRVCKEYESQDRNRKIKVELAQISQGNVSPILLEKILGKNRPVKSGSWEKWALMMLATYNSKRQA
jgi:hypothetical protein